jgi:hypothetical protein
LESGHVNVKKYYHHDADSLMGKEMWIRAEQVGGRRILNYRWTVGAETEQASWPVESGSSPNNPPTRAKN